MANHNSFPGPAHAESNPMSEIDNASAEALRRGVVVKFAPTQFLKEGRPKDAGEYHLAILCRTPGDTLTFDVADAQPGSEGNYMSVGGGDLGTVWVVTEGADGTPQRYGFANGYVYSHKAGAAWALDPNESSKMQLSVGQSAHIPGVGNIRPIKSILIGDKTSYVGSESDSWTGKDAAAARIVNAVDPLLEIARIGNAIRNGEDATFALDTLRHVVEDIPSTASFV
jgi:hypothetical protein